MDEKRAALERADAEVRRATTVGAQSYLARAEALRALGFSNAAEDDLGRAFRLGSSDPAVLAAVLASEGDPRLRMAAARAAMADDHAGGAARELAAATLLDGGDDPLIYARKAGFSLSGWVASRHGVAPRLWAVAADGTRLHVDVDRHGSHGAASDRWGWSLRDPAVRGGIVALRAVSAGGRAAKLPVAPHEVPLPARRRPAHVAAPDPGVTAVIPVYGDPGSLAACLASVALQGLSDLSVIVVDDASPDIAVSRLALDFCAGPRRSYLRSDTNRGFAVSVNAALARSRRTDVLLLNSDVVLPAGAVERLRRAARRAGDIGLVSPLSNDAGNASFPDPLAPEPVLPPAEASRLDRAAERVNAGLVVDLPSVHGSCLYLRRDCLDRVGPLSTAYGRGYYEDVDLCLRAREAGFRLVAACDVYVSHHGGRSFGADRDLLIARNVGVLDRLFPGHRIEDAAHDRADPLRRARAALEEAEPLLDGPTVLLVGRTATRGALLRQRARDAQAGGSEVITLCWSIEGDAAACRVGGEGPRGPRSLAFTLDHPGLERLGRYLRRVGLSHIELAEAAALPPTLAAWLFETDLAPVRIVVDGIPAAEALARAGVVDRHEPGRGRGRVAGIATDAMAEARAAALLTAGRPGPTGTAALSRVSPIHGAREAETTIETASVAVGRVLGVPLPQPCPAAEQLLAALARSIDRTPAARLLVFGAPSAAALAETGRCWVSGAMDVEELSDAFDHHAVDRLLLPYRDAAHWVLDAAGRGGRPAAFYDWAPSTVPLAMGDLALDPAETDAESCARILAWLTGQEAVPA